MHHRFTRENNSPRNYLDHDQAKQSWYFIFSILNGIVGMVLDIAHVKYTAGWVGEILKGYNGYILEYFLKKFARFFQENRIGFCLN